MGNSKLGLTSEVLFEISEDLYNSFIENPSSDYEKNINEEGFKNFKLVNSKQIRNSGYS